MYCGGCKKKIKKDESVKKIGLSNVHEGCISLFIDKHRQKAQKARTASLSSLEKTSEEVKRKKSITFTQSIFNRSVRASWADKKGMCICVTCGVSGNWEGSNIESGHYKTVGGWDHLRFDRRNIYPQCKRCNHYGQFPADIFEKYVRKHLGDEEHDKMLKDRTGKKHDLKKIREESRKILKEKGYAP